MKHAEFLRIQLQPLQQANSRRRNSAVGSRHDGRVDHTRWATQPSASADGYLFTCAKQSRV